MVLHVRLMLLGEEIVLVGTCEIPIASSTCITDTLIAGLTCSPSGVLSFIGKSSMLIGMAHWYIMSQTRAEYGRHINSQPLIHPLS